MELKTGFTFDDVYLVPKRSSIKSRRNVDTTTSLTKNIALSTPIVSANMDTVTEGTMSVTMAREGGIGIIHRFLPVEEQVSEVIKVKRIESVIIENPYTLPQNKTLKEAKEFMEAKGVKGILVTENGKLLGILTGRDTMFEDNLDRKISDLMTPRKQLVVGKPGLSIEEAKKILRENRVEKLPIVDKNWKLRGLITSKDIKNRSLYPHSTKDPKGRLMVGAAIGVRGDYIKRAEALLKAGVDVLVLDIAHGHSDNAINALRSVKKEFGDVDVIAGNVATREGVEDLASAGADAVKVGVGSGSICITRIVTGCGVPQLSAIFDCSEAGKELNVPIIADGGIRTSGDITKALAAGASTVMIGSLLGGTEESPGFTVIRNGAKYKITRGMASLGASMGRAERDKKSEEDLREAVPEGVEGIVPYRGYAREVLYQLVGGLRSGMSYCGATTLKELREKAEFEKITSASQKEGLPHDITLIK
ncbi:MAG: IMP dehydrogenase [Candidatus Aenigmarchaeota archaeon]|nr:IMP dehydrogenase [Candidatus Aenigmarchaeota archaeon]